jgi:hypothetical protein
MALMFFVTKVERQAVPVLMALLVGALVRMGLVHQVVMVARLDNPRRTHTLLAEVNGVVVACCFVLLFDEEC